MIFKFPGGVPMKCTDWLWENIGKGNIEPGKARKEGRVREHDDEWFFERITDIDDKGILWHVPSIDVFDEQKAIWFKLRWK